MTRKELARRDVERTVLIMGRLLSRSRLLGGALWFVACSGTAISHDEGYAGATTIGEGGATSEAGTPGGTAATNDAGAQGDAGAPSEAGATGGTGPTGEEVASGGGGEGFEGIEDPIWGRTGTVKGLYPSLPRDPDSPARRAAPELPELVRAPGAAVTPEPTGVARSEGNAPKEGERTSGCVMLGIQIIPGATTPTDQCSMPFQCAGDVRLEVSCDGENDGTFTSLCECYINGKLVPLDGLFKGEAPESCSAAVSLCLDRLP